MNPPIPFRPVPCRSYRDDDTGRTIKLRDAAADVLHRLHLAGATINATGDRLVFDAPDDAACATDLAELRRLKRHALDILETVGDIDSVTRPDDGDDAEADAATADSALANDAPDRARLLRLARAAGFPATPHPDPHRPERIVGPRTAWRRFAARAPIADVLDVLDGTPDSFRHGGAIYPRAETRPSARRPDPPPARHGPADATNAAARPVTPRRPPRPLAGSVARH